MNEPKLTYVKVTNSIVIEVSYENLFASYKKIDDSWFMTWSIDSCELRDILKAMEAKYTMKVGNPAIIRNLNKALESGHVIIPMTQKFTRL